MTELETKSSLSFRGERIEREIREGQRALEAALEVYPKTGSVWLINRKNSVLIVLEVVKSRHQQAQCSLFSAHREPLSRSVFTCKRMRGLSCAYFL